MPVTPWIALGEHTYTLAGATVLGLMTNDRGDGILIDSGMQDRVAQRAMDAAALIGVRIRAIVNTHHHADHVGGNVHLQRMVGATVHAPVIESPLIEFPQWEGVYLFGATPSHSLRDRFVRVLSSQHVQRLEEGKQMLWDIPFEMVPLHGHTPGHSGVMTPDHVLFVGDAVLSEVAYDRYILPFCLDIHSYLETLERLDCMSCVMVGAHTGRMEDSSALITINQQKIRGIQERILSLLDTPKRCEELLEIIMEPSPPFDLLQHSLVQCTLKAYLSALHSEGRVEIEVSGSRVMIARQNIS